MLTCFPSTHTHIHTTMHPQSPLPHATERLLSRDVLDEGLEEDNGVDDAGMSPDQLRVQWRRRRIGNLWAFSFAFNYVVAVGNLAFI